MTSSPPKKTGTLYGIGVGPGDPELITLKGARVLGECRQVFVPKARGEGDSAALAIAGAHLRADAEIHELVFPMITDRKELARRWEESAGQVAAVLQAGEDACFLTLGDPLLYSTYIYLLRALPEDPARGPGGDRSGSHGLQRRRGPERFSHRRSQGPGNYRPHGG